MFIACPQGAVKVFALGKQELPEEIYSECTGNVYSVVVAHFASLTLILHRSVSPMPLINGKQTHPNTQTLGLSGATPFSSFRQI